MPKLVSYYLPHAFILLLGIGLRFIGLSKPSLWVDEAFVDWFASKTWSELFYTLNIGGEVPAHYASVKLVIELLGRNEFSLRLFSALIGSVGIVLAIVIGWLVGNKPGGIAAGWFWAFSSMTIWYSRDAKPYAFTSALALALIITYLLSLRNRLKIYMFTAFILLACGLLCHYYFFLILASLSLFSLANMFREPLFFRRWITVSILALVPLSAWLFWFFSKPSPSLGIGWIKQPILSDLPLTLWNLFSGYGGQFSVQTAAFGAVAALIGLIGIVYGRDFRLARWSLLFGLLIPISAVWVVSQIRPIYMDRYFNAILPFAVIPMSIGAQTFWDYLSKKVNPSTRQITAFIAYIVLVSLGLLSSCQVYVDKKYERENWRELANYLESDEIAPKVWFSDSYSYLPFEYYFHGDPILIHSTSPPKCAEPCWYVMRQPYTATHAFTQGLTLSSRPWKPDLPHGCSLIDEWESQSGLSLWKVDCTED